MYFLGGSMKIKIGNEKDRGVPFSTASAAICYLSKSICSAPNTGKITKDGSGLNNPDNVTAGNW